MIHNDESYNFAAFYYYGIQHLLVSIELILQNAIKKNQLIYFSMDEDFYDTLLEKLRLNERLGASIQFYSTKEIIKKNNVKSFSSLQEEIRDINKKASEDGYSRVIWILKSEDAINQMSKEEFPKWKGTFAKILKDNDIKFVCIYDLYNYINNQEFIDNKYIIEESINTHDFILNEEDEHYNIE